MSTAPEDSSALTDPLVYQGLIEQANLLVPDNILDLSIFDTISAEAQTRTAIRFTQHKIGRIAEEAFSHFVQQSSRFRLLAEQVIIREDGITKGELDFLIHDNQTNQDVHIELACKFYLFDGTLGYGLAGWIGPNRSDLLKDKLHRIKNHQLPLLWTAATRKALADLHMDHKNIEQAVCLKGFLFTPKNQKVIPNMQVNQDAWAGHYYSLDELNERFDERTEVCWIPKPKWTVTPHDDAPWEFWKALKGDLIKSLEKKKSTLLWVRNKERQPERIFLVWW
jgi:hypothetical protein